MRRPEAAALAAWLKLALTAIDLLAWTKTLLLHHELATAEPKKLRYRLLHVAARVTRSGRRTRLHIAENWPWATDLVNAFTRLAAPHDRSPKPRTQSHQPESHGGTQSQHRILTPAQAANPTHTSSAEMINSS